MSYPDVVPVLDECRESPTDSDDDDDNDDDACVIIDATDVLLARREFVESLRHEEFGVNVVLNEDGQRLMDKQQQRLGRSLERLSKDLYSKDTHFVLELVQNADDNAYPPDMLEYALRQYRVMQKHEAICCWESNKTQMRVIAVSPC